MKYLLLAFILLISATTHAQFEKTETPKLITIGTAKTTGVKFSELFYYVSQTGDTMYHYRYKDKSYARTDVWESVVFKGGYEALEGLYGALKEAVNADKGAESSFKLGNSNVVVKSARMVGAKYINLVIQKDAGGFGLTDLTPKQIDGLFNK